MNNRHSSMTSRLQSLYEKKLTSYPRVDTRFLTDDIYPKCPGIIANLTDVCAGARPLVGRQLPKSKRVFDNSKVTDHHAIIPTGDTRNIGTLNDFEHKVYDLVVRRFCAAFYPACEYANTTVLANAGSLTFKVTGRTILSEGWRTVYGKELIDDDSQSNEKESYSPVIQSWRVWSAYSFHREEDDHCAQALY